jgi:hypothetical protein
MEEKTEKASKFQRNDRKKEEKLQCKKGKIYKTKII